MKHSELQTLIDEIRLGRTDRFSVIVDMYSDRIHALVASIAGDPMTADELTQDVFIKAFRTLSSFRGKSSLDTWIYRIAYNTAIDHSRRAKNNPLRLDDLQTERLSDTEVDAFLDNADEDDPRLSMLPKALDMLDPDDRALLTMFYFDDLPVKEIARITGISESNVKVRMLRSRKKLYALITHLTSSLETI